MFFGTPSFAVPTLHALAREHEIVLVVAQPDKPAGRGLKLQPPPVATEARQRNLPLAQPPKVREVIDRVGALRADAAVVVAYGKILPPALLATTRHGFFNVHASLLPKYRGAAPIQRAIEHGEAETGVTIMRVDEELDHGPMLSAVKTAIDPDERAPSLATRLAALGAEEMTRVLRMAIPETPQNHAAATYAPKVEKGEGEIRWNERTASIYNRFRAFDPWPGVFTGDLKFLEMRPVTASGSPGTILRMDSGVVVATVDGAIELLAVQRAGKSRTAALELARNAGWRVGAMVS